MDINKQKRVKIFLPLIFGLVLAFGMYIGSKLVPDTYNKKSIVTVNDKSKVQQVLDYINLKYVDTVNNELLMASAIKGVLTQLDPHSVYIPARQYQFANEALEGNFDGIGIEFYIVEDMDIE